MYSSSTSLCVFQRAVRIGAYGTLSGGGGGSGGSVGVVSSVPRAWLPRTVDMLSAEAGCVTASRRVIAIATRWGRSRVTRAVIARFFVVNQFIVFPPLLSPTREVVRW